MARFIKQFMTEGKFDYKKFSAHRQEMMESLDTLSEEPDNEQFTQEVKTAQDKSQGKGKKAEVAKPSVQAVKHESGELPEKVQETIEVFDANAINGVSVEYIEEGEDDRDIHSLYHRWAEHKASADPLNYGPAGTVSKQERQHYAGAGKREAAVRKAIVKIHGPATMHHMEKAFKHHDEYGDHPHAAREKHHLDVATMASKRSDLYAEGVEYIEERELTSAESKKKEEVVKSMKKKLPGFKERYGERAKEVMYATATKIAKKD